MQFSAYYFRELYFATATTHLHMTDTVSSEEANGCALIHTELLASPQLLSQAQWWNRAWCNLECAGPLKEKNKDTAQS